MKGWLTAQGWNVEGSPSEPRSRNGPWKIFAKHLHEPERDEHVYTMECSGKTKHITLVPWKPIGKRAMQKDAESICRHKWYNENAEFTISPTLKFEPEIAPTVPDSSMEPEDEKNGKGKKTAAGAIISPMKKMKVADECKVVGGVQGPDGTRTLDLGGAGDCAWRCLAFQLAMTNCQWRKAVSEIRPKVEQLSKALRAQTLHYLLNIDTSWKESWCPDPKWNKITEDGIPATTLNEFEQVITRENRWICHFGLQAICCLKRVCIAIWRMTSSGWVKIAVMKPKEKSEKAPVLGLVLAGGHYFALVRTSEKSGLPKEWAQKPGPCMWQTAGISTDPIESASQAKLDTSMFRGAGKFTTPSRKKTDGDDLDLLRTCSTSGSSSKQCSFYDNEALDLLRSCSQQTISEIGDKVHAETEKEDEKKLSKKEKIHLANRKRAVLGGLHACGATEFERRSQAMSFCKLTSFNSILKGETVIGLKQLLPKDDVKFKTPGHLRGKKKAMTTLLRLCTWNAEERQ